MLLLSHFRLLCAPCRGHGPRRKPRPSQAATAGVTPHRPNRLRNRAGSLGEVGWACLGCRGGAPSQRVQADAPTFGSGQCPRPEVLAVTGQRPAGQDEARCRIDPVIEEPEGVRDEDGALAGLEREQGADAVDASVRCWEPRDELSYRHFGVSVDGDQQHLDLAADTAANEGPTSGRSVTSPYWSGCAWRPSRCPHAQRSARSPRAVQVPRDDCIPETGPHQVVQNGHWPLQRALGDPHRSPPRLHANR